MRSVAEASSSKRPESCRGQLKWTLVATTTVALAVEEMAQLKRRGAAGDEELATPMDSVPRLAMLHSLDNGDMRLALTASLALRCTTKEQLAHVACALRVSDPDDSAKKLTF